MTVSDLLKQPCNKSDNINKIVTSCSQLVDNLGVRTQLVGRLATSCEILRVYANNRRRKVKPHVTLNPKEPENL